jgi:hypothetical protein
VRHRTRRPKAPHPRACAAAAAVPRGADLPVPAAAPQPGALQVPLSHCALSCRWRRPRAVPVQSESPPESFRPDLPIFKRTPPAAGGRPKSTWPTRPLLFPSARRPAGRAGPGRSQAPLAPPPPRPALPGAAAAADGGGGVAAAGGGGAAAGEMRGAAASAAARTSSGLAAAAMAAIS